MTVKHVRKACAPEVGRGRRHDLTHGELETWCSCHQRVTESCLSDLDTSVAAATRGLYSAKTLHRVQDTLAFVIAECSSLIELIRRIAGSIAELERRSHQVNARLWVSAQHQQRLIAEPGPP